MTAHARAAKHGHGRIRMATYGHAGPRAATPCNAMQFNATHRVHMRSHASTHRNAWPYTTHGNPLRRAHRAVLCA
eukprot:4635627-Alexandrium_andersonii.AAC.1